MEVKVTTEGELFFRVDGLAPRVRLALRAKMDELVDQLYAKVMENLNGGVLQRKSGALAESIQHGVEEQGDLLIGFVAPEPQDAKALALELGGSNYYWIFPSKARLLRFLGSKGDIAYASSVFHPPSRAYRYLGSAFDDIALKIGPELAAVAAQALHE